MFIIFVYLISIVVSILFTFYFINSEQFFRKSKEKEKDGNSSPFGGKTPNKTHHRSSFHSEQSKDSGNLNTSPIG